MTTAAELVTRVRTNINEPAGNTDSQRSDLEIRTWLDEGQIDYVLKIPGEAVPEVTSTASATVNPWSIPTDLLKILRVDVSHTISGTYVGTEQAYLYNVRERYAPDRWPGGIGTWAQTRDNKLYMGPNFLAAEISYLRRPTNLSGSGAVTFELGVEHESPVVNYATVLGLGKVNDADADRYGALYDDRIAQVWILSGQEPPKQESA